MPTYLSNQARAHRKRWALSQRDLAFLFGLSSQGVISHHETRTRTPETKVLLAYEVLFDTPAGELFPVLRRDAEKRILARAKLLQQRLESAPSRVATRKLELIRGLIERVGPRRV